VDTPERNAVGGSERYRPVITRRDLLKAVGGGVLFAATGGSLLEAPSTASTLARELARSSARNRQNVINVLIPADPPALDPVKYNAHDIERIYRQVTEQLYQWNPDKTITPLLAESMPKISRDGRTYTIHLRSGIKFHNGKPFDSSDVKYTYEQCLAPSNGSIWLAALGLVKSVEAPNPRTVVIKLSAPYTPMLSSLALIPIVPSNIPYTATTYARRLVGTGPFRFVSWNQGVAIKLAKNPHYWQRGLPHSNGVSFSIVSSSASQVADLVNGSAQLIAEVAARDVGVLRRKGMHVYVEPNSSIIDYMYPNVQPGRFTANRFARLAIAWAIDRQQVVSQVFAGIGQPESSLPVHGAEFYDAKLGAYFGKRPDLAKARSYLAQAGGPPSHPLDLVVLADDITNPTAAIVQQNLAAIGIATNIIPLGITAALGRLFSQQYDLFLLDVLAQESTGFGSYIAYLAVYPGAFANFNKFSSVQLARLAERAVTVTNPSQQAAAWRAVQQMWVQQVPQIVICSSRYIEASSPSLQGYHPTGLAQLEHLKYASVS